jgi:hypothetical protein
LASSSTHHPPGADSGAPEPGPKLNPISVAHQQTTKERLISKLGAERYDELTTEGATLDYDQAVAVARVELDRVVEDATSP